MRTISHKPLRTEKVAAMGRRNMNSIRLLTILLLIIVVAIILQPELFPTKSNFVSMAVQFPEYGLMALGCALAMIVGGIDLSLVGIANLVAITAASLLCTSCPDGTGTGMTLAAILMCTVLGIMIGAVCGMFNGFLVGKIKIPAMLATLGSAQLFTGIGMIITKGKAVTGFPYLLVDIGTATIGGILPVPLLIFILCTAVIWYVVEKSTFGLRIRMLGTNEKASQLAGQNNLSIFMRTYMLGGILAAFSGIIMLARINSARADYGTSYSMQAILISVLGGVNPNGGFGTVSGVVIATLILQCFASCLNMFGNLNSYFRDFAWGLTLIIVIAINHYTAKGRKRKP
mgnify:CR=1 FL=1